MPEPGEVGPDFTIRDDRFRGPRGPGGPLGPGGKPPEPDPVPVLPEGIIRTPPLGTFPPLGILPQSIPSVDKPVSGPRVATFPRLPGANDPVFSIFGRIVARGLGVIGAAVILGDVVRMAQEERIRRKMLEDEAAEILRRLQVRRRRGKPVKVTPEKVFFPDPIGDPLPEIVVTPTRPASPIFDPIPVEIPMPSVPLPAPVQVPQLPQPGLPGKTPKPPVRRVKPPRPTKRPSTRPSTLPRRFPFSTPVFFPIPQLIPRRRRFIVADPQPEVIGDPQLLTPLQGGGLPSPLPTGVITTVPQGQPSSSPQQQTRRCQEVKRRRRRKGKCREGFFEELPGKTKYTTWREVDCITRRPKRKLRVVR